MLMAEDVCTQASSAKGQALLHLFLPYFTMKLLLLWTLLVGCCVSVRGFATIQRSAPSSVVVPTRPTHSYHHRRQHVSEQKTRTTLVLSTRAAIPDSYHRENPLRQLARSVWSRVQQTSEVTRWRGAAVAFFSTLILHRQAIDVQLAHLWTYLTTSTGLFARIFRTDSYEWCLAVAAFGVFIHLFGYADRAVRREADRGRVHPWRKYRLQDRYEADKHRRRVLAAAGGRGQPGAGAGSDASAVVNMQEMPPVKQSKWHWQAWVFEFWVYVLPLLIWDVTSPRRFRRLAAFGPPTTMKILGDIAGGLLLYDILFFCGHFLMHKVPILYRAVHKKHHKTDEVRACDIVRLSLPEEVYDVACSIVALNLLGAHPLARSLYNLIIVFLLCELHCGFDFPWTPQNVVPFGLATGSRRHHYHHRFGTHYYQKFFFTVDRLFGFFQKDDGSLKGDSVKKEPFIPAEWKSA